MNTTLKKDFASHNSLDEVIIMGAFEQGFYANPLNNTSTSLKVPKKVFVINSIGKVGGILASSENQYEFSLENLHKYSKAQETSNKSTEKSCVYEKLAPQFFQEYYSLTGNLSDNEDFAIVKNYSYIEKGAI